MAENKSIYREEALEKISTPEQLTSYLRVTNPAIWSVLLAVVMLLGGLVAWSTIGTLETTAQATVVVQDKLAEVTMNGMQTIDDGMPLRVRSQEYVIDYVYADELGNPVGEAQVDLPDGRYEGTVVVESIHPIAFLFESR